MQYRKLRDAGNWLLATVLFSVGLVICSFIVGNTQQTRPVAQVKTETKMDSLQRLAVEFNKQVNAVEARVNDVEKKVKKNDSKPAEVSQLINQIVNQPPRVVYREKIVLVDSSKADTGRHVDPWPPGRQIEVRAATGPGKRHGGFFTFRWLTNIFKSKENRK